MPKDENHHLHGKKPERCHPKSGLTLKGNNTKDHAMYIYCTFFFDSNLPASTTTPPMTPQVYTKIRELVQEQQQGVLLRQEAEVKIATESQKSFHDKLSLGLTDRRAAEGLLNYNYSSIAK